MRLFIKGDYTKDVPYTFFDLAGKMWFKEKNGKKPQLSYGGYRYIKDKNDIEIGMLLRKVDHDPRWWSTNLGNKSNSKSWPHQEERLSLEFKEGYISDCRLKNGEYLHIISDHADILTVDRRAMFIMAIEIATVFEGQISEDDKQTWISVEEFKERHQDILSLTYEEANEISLKEILTIDTTNEPYWEELRKLREAYIEEHGEPTDEDYEDYEEDEEEPEDNEETNDYPETKSDNWFG